MEEENSNVDQVCATENTVQWDELNVNPTTLSADFQSARDNTPDLERAPWMSKAQVRTTSHNALSSGMWGKVVTNNVSRSISCPEKFSKL